MSADPGNSRTARRVLVTGASRGIGRAIALRLARDGFDVALGYLHSKSAAEGAAAEIGQLGRGAELLHFDVADRDACSGALEADIAAGGAYWGAVLNAGVNADAAFPALSEEAWDRVLRTNLDGFYNVLRPLVMPMIRRRDGGRIVTLSSLAGVTGSRGQVNYAASKAGIIGATKSLAHELAKRSITVNCVAPGWIETEMLEGADLEALAAGVPLRRLGTPDDVAASVSFLFSDGASYITGQVISVNGGLL
jgi:3-oxoacyl-[acyl-carrier protein] reductase